MHSRLSSLLDKKFFNIRFEYILLSLILLLTLFSKLYNLEIRFPFGWDQARDAEMMWQILREGKLTLIGPQVVSDDAFFLGPFWYYMLTPFYFLSGMDPLGSAAAVVTSGFATVLAIYLFFKKIAGRGVAIIASILWATIPEVIAWNPMVIPLFEIGILFCLLKITQGYKKFIMPAFLLFGLSLQIHFQMIFLAIPLAFSWLTYIKNERKIPFPETLLGTGIFLLTFAPLLIFDLRHNFINFQGFKDLFGIGANSSNNYYDYYTQLTITFPKFIYSHFFLPELPFPKEITGIAVILSSIVGIILLRISKAQKLIFLSLIILPVFAFSFYKGRLSEYYFVICSIPILLGLANFLKLIFKFPKAGILPVAGFLILVSYLNIHQILSHKNLTTGLGFQRQAVKYLKNQTEDRIINVSFDVPVNFDGGIKYLFKYYDLNPQDIPEGHLWTIAIPAHDKPEPYKVIYGEVGVIRR